MAERRQVKRYTLPDAKARTQIVAVVGGDHCTGGIGNLSATGVSLLVDRRLEPGSLVALELNSAGGTFTCILLAWVVHTTLSQEGGFVTGCNFTQEVGEDELRALLA
jgi:hypothetical protein